MLFKIIFLSCFLLMPGMMHTSYAGIYIEERIETNLPGRVVSGIKKTYFTEKKVLIIDPFLSSRVIYDFENNKVYLIDDVKKYLSTTDASGFAIPINEEIFEQFLTLNEKDLHSKESGSWQTIGAYKCFEVVVYIPRLASLSRIWITKDIKLPISPYISFLEKNSKDIILKKIMPVLKENDAFIVSYVMTIVRPKELDRYFNGRLLKISEQDIPDELFNLPVDYTKVSLE